MGALKTPNLHKKWLSKASAAAGTEPLLTTVKFVNLFSFQAKRSLVGTRSSAEKYSSFKWHDVDLNGPAVEEAANLANLRICESGQVKKKGGQICPPE